MFLVIHEQTNNNYQYISVNNQPYIHKVGVVLFIVSKKKKSIGTMSTYILKYVFRNNKKIFCVNDTDDISNIIQLTSIITIHRRK